MARGDIEMEKAESDQNFTKKNALRVALAEHGWRVAAVEASNLPWWVDEQWTIESIWSPQHLQVQLSFLVDPQSDANPRKKGADVWAIGICPDGWTSGVSFCLNGEWIEELMTELAGRRNAGRDVNGGGELPL